MMQHSRLVARATRLAAPFCYNKLLFPSFIYERKEDFFLKNRLTQCAKTEVAVYLRIVIIVMSNGVVNHT